MAANYHFSKPVELHEDDEFRQARLFMRDRRANGLDVNTGRISGSHVVEVSDEPDDQLYDALRAAGADILGAQYPYARAGFVRNALRPASRGAGRDRWR
jgi:hypothetical protein